MHITHQSVSAVIVKEFFVDFHSIASISIIYLLSSRSSSSSCVGEIHSIYEGSAFWIGHVLDFGVYFAVEGVVFVGVDLSEVGGVGVEDDRNGD